MKDREKEIQLLIYEESQVISKSKKNIKYLNSELKEIQKNKRTLNEQRKRNNKNKRNTKSN